MPKAINKRRKGRFVEYLFVVAGEKRKWKKQKDMTSDEREACRIYRDDSGETRANQEKKAAKERIKLAAKRYADAAIRGDRKAIDRMEKEHQKLFDAELLENELAECINFATTRTDDDIGDWGNVKHSVHIFEDTPLITAVRHSNLAAVHTLLRSGLCDPTLQICPQEYIWDRYTMYESDK